MRQCVTYREKYRAGITVSPPREKKSLLPFKLFLTEGREGGYEGGLSLKYLEYPQRKGAPFSLAEGYSRRGKETIREAIS